MSPHFPARRALLRATLVAGLAALVPPAIAGWSPPAPMLAQVDIYDRTSGSALSVHAKDGRSYVVGRPGHEYAIRIRNCTGARILAVTSVDGVNVISGDTASPDQVGYVIEPWGSVQIAGWRKSDRRTAAFFFAEHAQSYAARTGRPFDVGVIGVAVFAERSAPPPPPRVGISEGKRESRAQADAASPAPPSAEGSTAAEGVGRNRQESEAPSAPDVARGAQPLAKLGTGHGRSESSYVQRVNFERATPSPAQWVALQYDRYENLVAQGVIAAPQIARTPRPFPAQRYVPDPR